MRSHFPKRLVVAALLAASLPCTAQDSLQLELVPWANGLSLALDVTHCGDGRLFVARQHGVISIVTDSMVVLPTPFLNIQSQVLNNGERGLLGLAFDPDYANNGFFYVNYTAPPGIGTTRISRFHVSADPNVADPLSEVILMTLPQPDPIHESGGLVFGNDGYLYVALGDGGGASDPNAYGQDLDNLFGIIARIKPEPDSTYSIPPDNPFANSTEGERPEIWAYGLRNPYRIAIDPANGDLWIGDVGQALWEEIDHWPAGANTAPNFGWRCYEGNSQFIFDGDCSVDSTYVFPEVVKAHSTLGGTFCAIVGGEVYRGAMYPRMFGRYLYTDFCAGELRTLTATGPDAWVDSLALLSGQVGLSSIGADLEGELYATNVINGKLFKIKDRCPMDAPVVVQDGGSLLSTAGASYQWFFEGIEVPDAVDQTILPFQAGNYSVQVTYSNGCVKTSLPFFYLSTGVAASMADHIRVHPQPATNAIVIERNVVAESTWYIRLFDATGRMLERSTWSAGTTRTQIDVSGLRSGVYVIDLVDAEGRPVHRRTVAVAH